MCATAQARGILDPPALGDHWFDAIPNDCNYLLNPQHLDFAQIAVHPPEPFRFDPRLFEF